MTGQGCWTVGPLKRRSLQVNVAPAADVGSDNASDAGTSGASGSGLGATRLRRSNQRNQAEQQQAETPGSPPKRPRYRPSQKTNVKRPYTDKTASATALKLKGVMVRAAEAYASGAGPDGGRSEVRTRYRYSMHVWRAPAFSL